MSGGVRGRRRKPPPTRSMMKKPGKKIVDESGNIHTHIVINSVRKTAVERQTYMDKPHEEAAGYKHRSTDKFMSTFKKTVMDRCQQEGLHQIDLLAPAEEKNHSERVYGTETRPAKT